MIKPFFSLGPINIHYYGLLISLSIVAGYLLAKKRAKFYKIPQKLFDDYLLLIPLALSIILARVYHVIDNWNYYSTNLSKIIQISAGGLGIWGAIIGVFFGLAIFAKIKKINTFALFDLVSPFLILGQAVGRIGNWINEEGFGPPTDLPWKMFVTTSKRPLEFAMDSYFHPTFFYEAILNFIGFLLLFFLYKKFNSSGQLFGLYLICYGIIRTFTENFRMDTWEINSLKVSYIFSTAAIIIGVYFFTRRKPLETVLHIFTTKKQD